MGNDHRRHSKAELGALSLAPYYIRFITAGDPASDRGTFGDVATQPAQIGEALNNSTAGNATIAMRYDQKIRACATNYPNPERAHATSQSASGTESAHRARSRPRMWIGANRRAPQFGFGAVRRKSKRMGAAKTPSRGGKEERATAKFRGENDRGPNSDWRKRRPARSLIGRLGAHSPWSNGGGQTSAHNDRKGERP